MPRSKQVQKKKKQPFQDVPTKSLAAAQNVVTNVLKSKRKRLPSGSTPQKTSRSKSLQLLETKTRRRVQALAKLFRSSDSSDDAALLNALAVWNEQLETDSHDDEQRTALLDAMASHKVVSLVLQVLQDRLTKDDDDESMEEESTIVDHSTDLVLASLQLLHNVTHESNANCQVLVESESVSTILTALFEQHHHWPDAFRHVCGLLQNVAYDNLDRKQWVRRLLDANETPEHVLVTGLLQYQHDAEVTWQALGFWGNLCQLPASCRALVRWHGVPAVLRVMRAHASNAAVQARACLVLGRLCSHDSVAATLVESQGGAASLAAAWQRHGSVDEDVEHTATLALERLLWLDRDGDEDEKKVLLKAQLERWERILKAANGVTKQACAEICFGNQSRLAELLDVVDYYKSDSDVDQDEAVTRALEGTHRGFLECGETMNPDCPTLAASIVFYLCDNDRELKRRVMDAKGVESLFHSLRRQPYNGQFRRQVLKTLVRLTRGVEQKRTTRRSSRLGRPLLQRVPEAPVILSKLLHEEVVLSTPIDNVAVKNVCGLLLRCLNEDSVATKKALALEEHAALTRDLAAVFYRRGAWKSTMQGARQVLSALDVPKDSILSILDGKRVSRRARKVIEQNA